MSGQAASGFQRNPHLEQGLPKEWSKFGHAGHVYIARDVPEGVTALYVVSARSHNVRTFAKADAAIYDGTVCRTYYHEERGAVEFTHDYAATIAEHHITDWLEHPAIRLKTLRNGSGSIEEARE